MSPPVIPPEIPVTLSILVAQLGELESLRFDEDTTAEQWQRQEAVFPIAGLLPVRTAQDATIALSMVADHLMQVIDFDLDERERERFLRLAMQASARVASWLRADHGARPLMGMWPSWADPFDGTREAET